MSRDYVYVRETSTGTLYHLVEDHDEGTLDIEIEYGIGSKGNYFNVASNLTTGRGIVDMLAEAYENGVEKF